MNPSEKTNAAVYVSWKTFLNAIEQLSRAELPNVIDKTVFPGMAFSVQNQLFTGMRFLGLIDDKNKPMADLESLTGQDEGHRKAKLKEIFQHRYSDLIALNLKKTTPDELVKKMGESYGVRGDTCDKAVRFFISGANYLAIEMSPLIAGKKTNGASRVATSRRRGKGKTNSPQNMSETPPSTSGTSKTVRLQSGGTLTLSATLDLFRLNAEDRKFVFEFIDKLEAYKQPTESADKAE